MPRGGKRQGTPGKAYSNRIDLQASPDMEQNTVATGGMKAAPPKGRMPAPPPTLSRTPDDSPMLTAPSQRSWEPVTTGSDYGPGLDSSALNIPSYKQANQQDMQLIKEIMPRLVAASKMNDAPETFKQLVSYLKRMR